MSEENVQVAAEPGEYPARWRAKPYRPVRRTPDRILLARWPWLLKASSRSLLRLKPGSWRRRRLLERAYRTGFDANADGRSAETLAFFHPDVELYVSVSDAHAPPGLDRRYDGYEGFLRLFDDWKEVWGNWHLELLEFFDFGDRLAITCTWVGQGTISGIEIRTPHAGIWTFKDGLCLQGRAFLGCGRDT